MNRRFLLHLLLGFAGLLLIVLATGFAIIHSRHQEITQWAITQMNKDFIGELEVKSSRISLFHDFPYVDIDLQGVVFYGDKSKSKKPLYQVNDLYLGFRWWDVIRSNFDIRLINVDGGHADIVQFANGEVNLLLAKNIKTKEEPGGENSPLRVHLKKFMLTDFTISFFQEADSTHVTTYFERSRTSVRVNDQHIFALVDATTRMTLQLRGQSTFLSDKPVTLRTDLDYQTDRKEVVLRDTHLGLADALFGFAGKIHVGDSAFVDLRVEGEKPDFTLFASFAPTEVAENLKNYRNAGKIFFEGTVMGPVGHRRQPEINFRFGCENGFFENSRSNKKIEDLQFTGTYTNGAGHSLETSVFELRDFSVTPERGTFMGNLRVQNFVDPQVAVALRADLDLEFLGEFLGVQGVQRLRGNVIVDMNFDEIIDLNRPETSLLRMKEGIESELTVRDLSFIVPGYRHPITKLNLHAAMVSGQLTLDTCEIEIADSDLRLRGSISHLPALFHRPDQEIKFTLEGEATRINLSRLLTLDSAKSPAIDEDITDFRVKLAFETSVSKIRKSPLPQGEFFIEDLYGKIKGYPHTFHDIHADVIIRDSTFQLKDFSGEIDQSDFHFNGRLTNYNLWFEPEKYGDTRFEFDLFSEQLRLDNLLSYKGENYLPEDYRHEVLSELKLHGLVDLNFRKNFHFADLLMEKAEARLNIHPLKMEKMKGRIHYENEHLTIQDLSANMGGSDITLNLTYYTGLDSVMATRDNRLSLRARRLNADQLLAYNPSPTQPKEHAKAFNLFEVPFPNMVVEADIAALRHHQLEISNFHARARTRKDHFMFLDTLRMELAGGSFALNGYLKGSDPKKIYFKSTCKFDQLDIDKLFFKFDNFGQDFLVNQNLHGNLTGTINSLFHVHPDLTPILHEGAAHLDLYIANGSLVNFGPLQAMAGYFKDKNLNQVRFDTLRNRLDLVDGTLSIPAMTINSSLGFIEMEGRQSLDLKMDYLIRVPFQMVTQVGFQALFGGRKKDEVDPDQEDAIQYRDPSKRTRFVNIRVRGTPDAYTFALGRKSEGRR